MNSDKLIDILIIDDDRLTDWLTEWWENTLLTHLLILWIIEWNEWNEQYKSVSWQLYYIAILMDEICLHFPCQIIFSLLELEYS